MTRKTNRIVRTPATKFPKLQKRLQKRPPVLPTARKHAARKGGK